MLDVECRISKGVRRWLPSLGGCGFLAEHERDGRLSLRESSVFERLFRGAKGDQQKDHSLAGWGVPAASWWARGFLEARALDSGIFVAILTGRENDVTTSVLEAIRRGYWDFEPENVAETHFESTEAMPGTNDKLAVLAKRVQQGLPLWHSCDRTDFEETERSTPCQR